MKKALFLLLFLFIIRGLIIAQKTDNQSSLKPSLRKNSFYIENLVILPSINYDRIFPLNNNIGLVLKIGLYSYAKIHLLTEATFLFGNTKHFFEIGGGTAEEKGQFGLYGRIGYRYIGNKGLMLRGGINYVKNVPIFPYIGIGFSF